MTSSWKNQYFQCNVFYHITVASWWLTPRLSVQRFVQAEFIENIQAPLYFHLMWGNYNVLQSCAQLVTNFARHVTQSRGANVVLVKKIVSSARRITCAKVWWVGWWVGKWGRGGGRECSQWGRDGGSGLLCIVVCCRADFVRYFSCIYSTLIRLSINYWSIIW